MLRDLFGSTELDSESDGKLGELEHVVKLR